MLMVVHGEAIDVPCSTSLVNAEKLISENALKAVKKILVLGQNKTWGKKAESEKEERYDRKKENTKKKMRLCQSVN